MNQTTVNIKPLTVNRAWKGRRYKTQEYSNYEEALLYLLPDIEIPEPPYAVFYVFGFSSKNSDLANPEKLITDILCKKYKFDDRYISHMELTKEFVPKGKEFVSFRIEHYDKLRGIVWFYDSLFRA